MVCSLPYHSTNHKLPGIELYVECYLAAPANPQLHVALHAAIKVNGQHII